MPCVHKAAAVKRLKGVIDSQGKPKFEFVEYKKERDKEEVAFYLKWPEPFSEMFPTGGGADLLWHHYQMRKCINDLRENFLDAKKDIYNWTNKFTTKGWSTLERVWIEPKLTSENLIEGILGDADFKYGIDVDNINQLIKHPKYEQIFRHPIEITRCFGWEGYFWWGLNKAVNCEYKNITFCQRCKSIISGRRNKKYCSREENPTCFKTRRAEDKRRERTKRR